MRRRLRGRSVCTASTQTGDSRQNRCETYTSERMVSFLLRRTRPPPLNMSE